MSLIISISGIRGTIGGKPGEGLTPVDAVQFASAYGAWVRKRIKDKKPQVVIGRDARVSGQMVENLVSGTLAGMGIDVVLLGMASTPTVEMAVTALSADGGIILTASHNPGEWNALKLLNGDGEFLSASDGEQILESVRSINFEYAPVHEIGQISSREGMDDVHLDAVLNLPLVREDLVRKAGFRVAVDCVNSVGGIILPKLLRRLGVSEIIELNCEPTGIFPHNPEPLPENLTAIAGMIRQKKADLGLVVDPDVDRLAIVCEDGTMFGEEYTLVAVADYILSHTPGNTCSNLSSTRALKDLSDEYGVNCFASAVGEVNVVELMKKKECVIGGEGNGGVIYPALHYGRDALAGSALFLSHLAALKIPCSELKKKYPEYHIVKNRISLTSGTDVDGLLDSLEARFNNEKINREDGLKIDLDRGWIHLRKSNTEPIIRIYTEAGSKHEADLLTRKVMDILNEIMN